MDDIQAFFSEVERGDLETVRAMMSAAPKLVHVRDGTGATALHVAAFHGHHTIVELLLGAGAEVNARDDRFGATLRSAVDRAGKSLAEHAAAAPDPAISKLFGR